MNKQQLQERIEMLGQLKQKAEQHIEALKGEAFSLHGAIQENMMIFNNLVKEEREAEEAKKKEAENKLKAKKEKAKPSIAKDDATAQAA